MHEEVTAKQSRVFAGYHLLRRVNISATAEIYRASQPDLAPGKRFLVKRYASKNPTLAHAIARRCMKLRAVNHPTLPPILDHGVVSGFPYVAREYVRGVDLQRLMQRLTQRELTLPLEQLVAILSAILDGLDLLHLASKKESPSALTHGDVSPEHIMVSKDGSPTLIGFETPRGHVSQLPAPAMLDISVPSAIVFSYLQSTRHAPPHDDQTLNQRRRQLREAVEPLARRGLDLDAKRAYRSPGELRDALRDCLDFAGFLHEPSGLAATLASLAESAQGADDTVIGPGQPALTPRRTSTGDQPLQPALDVGFPDSNPMASPPLPGEPSGTWPRRSPRVPAPIDYGGSRRSTDDPDLAHPLPAFEIGIGDDALEDETAAWFEEMFPDIIDRFDEESAEHSFDEISNPFGIDQLTGSRSEEVERTRTVQRIGNVLIDLGFVSHADVHRALASQGRGGVRLGEALVMDGVITEAQLVQALALLHDARPLRADEVDGLKPDAQVVKLLPTTFVAAHRIVPISIDAARDAALVLVADPSDVQTLTETRVLLDTRQIHLMVSTRDALDSMISRIYPPDVRAEVSSVKATVLLVDPDDSRRRPFAHRLRAERFVVEEMSSSARARRVLDSSLPSALIVCIDDPSEGFDLLGAFTERPAARGAYAALACTDLSAHLERAEQLEVDLVSLPLRVDYIVAKIRRSLVERPDTLPPIPADGVRGDISDMNLLELTQTLRLGRKDATVLVRAPGGEGNYVLREGNVVHASFQEAIGEDAFFRLCVIEQGAFEVTYGGTGDIRRTVFDSTESLLIEAARRSWFSDDEPVV